jgi:hypothetical protein
VWKAGSPLSDQLMLSSSPPALQNPQKLEMLLHTFFGRACLDVDVIDSGGRRYVPREWFVAPLEIIEQAIHFVLNGEIVNFRYDPDRKVIVGR